MAQANPRRSETSEAWKCRSSRDSDRVVGFFASNGARGGKTPRTFGGKEGVTAEHARDVVMPASIPATLEVIEAELLLQILVDAFGVPALLEKPDEVLERATAVREQVKMRGMPCRSICRSSSFATASTWFGARSLLSPYSSSAMT